MLEDKKKHHYLIEIAEEERRWKEKQREEAETDAFIADMEQKLAERKAHAKQIPMSQSATKTTSPVTPPETCPK